MAEVLTLPAPTTIVAESVFLFPGKQRIGIGIRHGDIFEFLLAHVRYRRIENRHAGAAGEKASGGHCDAKTGRRDLAANRAVIIQADADVVGAGAFPYRRERDRAGDRSSRY